MDVLTIQNLKKNFGSKEVLRGLDLSVPEHSIFGFIGRNGAGKTTTMKAILGLLKTDGGQISVCGEKVHFGQTRTNRHIGYLPDVPEFYPYMTPLEYLHFCGEISEMDKADLAARSNELLELVGLRDEQHRIKGFSRGMKQRLGIAQALLNRPKLLICDEPTSALDPVGRKEILDILLAAKEQTTILFSTHILSDVERICTEAAFLNDGRIAMQGTIAELRSMRPSDGFVIEVKQKEDADILIKTFGELKTFDDSKTLDDPKSFDGSKASDNSKTLDGSKAFDDLKLSGDLKADGQNTLIFHGGKERFFFILQYIAKNQIPVQKIERIEPTLESLFLEVTK